MAWCKRLWAPVPKALAGLLLLWRVMWVALTCYKVCWEAAFHLLEEACFSLTLWLEGGDEASQGNGPSSPHLRPSDPLWPKQAGTEELEEKVQAVQEPSGAVLGRLAALEAGVQYLSQELRAEKLLWSSRYLDLLREQQDLLVQVQRRDALWLKDVEGQSATGGADGNWPEEPAGSSIQRCRPGLPDWRRRLHARATQSKPHQASWHGGGEAGTATLG
ncbi:uncharacterized protein LOC128332550 [Hemicordylus capensis]|uniref:uncharacterized protein LOC128332550 n=1 Tax=Hemicordylus capensis TaxID=884348 RepID=UPI00230454A5|nr:uncharacterized protein LOC128332550 [Hemicordylus capensis]